MATSKISGDRAYKLQRQWLETLKEIYSNAHRTKATDDEILSERNRRIYSTPEYQRVPQFVCAYLDGATEILRAKVIENLVWMKYLDGKLCTTEEVDAVKQAEGPNVEPSAWARVDTAKSRYVWKEVVSYLPERLCTVLESLGVECEWSDEWTSCDECGNLVRTQGDSYSWQSSLWVNENGCWCKTCVEKDPVDYFQWLSGNADACEIFDLNLEMYGYERLDGDSFESGMHPGQNDKPEEIAEKLEEEGITDFIFSLDAAGQFDCKFSVWFKRSEEKEENDE